MNTIWHSPSAIERALGERLRLLLGSIAWLQDVHLADNPAPYNREFDWLASFKVPRGPLVELWVDCRAEPRPAHFPYVSVEREFDKGSTKLVRIRVFAAPRLSSRMRELCEKHGWSWYDLAGNCRINAPGIIYLERTGLSPVAKKTRQGVNIGTREASRVIRALLTPFYIGWNWTQRSMQQHCQPGVSLGLVNKVVRHLQGEAYIEVGSEGGFRLADPLNLLFAWRHAYRFEQHLRQEYFTLLQGKALRDALATLGIYAGGLAAYAAFSAADFQAPHVRQPKTWLYVAEREMNRFRDLLDAKPVQSGENLIILQPADEGVFFQPDVGDSSEQRLPCTNLVQTYVDLWYVGSRGQEAAEALLEQRLKPMWKAHGYPI